MKLFVLKFLRIIFIYKKILFEEFQMKKSTLLLHTFLCTAFLLGGTPVLAAEPAQDTPQKVSAQQGIYEIVSAADTDFLLDIRHCTYSETDHHTVQLYRRLDVNQQKFYIEELPSSFCRITTLHSGEALTVSDQISDTSRSVLMTEVARDKKIPSNDQIWLLKDAGSGMYYIQARTGGYLTLDDTDPYLGASVSLQDFTGKDTQKWQLASSWISTQDCADTDLINPYEEDGAYADLQMVIGIGEEDIVITAEDLVSWTSETEDHQLNTDISGFTALAQDLADRYDTQGHARKFRTTSGEEITLYKGNFGWKLDVEETAENLMETAQNRGLVRAEPVWEHKGVLFTRGDDIGDSYVEIDLINQKVWLYKDGEMLLETDCVTGTYGTDRQTPGGVYSIYYKQSPDILEGPGYSSYVEYWMPFNGGIGLHDANWRYAFGGDIYLSNGSHGCINLPTEAAKLLYETTYIGYPVVCYN